MEIEKIKILGAVLELPAKQHCQSSPFTSKLGQIGTKHFYFFNCHGCRLFILCEIHCYLSPTFLWYYDLVLAIVFRKVEDFVDRFRAHPDFDQRTPYIIGSSVHGQSSYWTAKSLFLFLAGNHTEADPNYTLGVDFWTKIFLNLKNSC